MEANRMPWLTSSTKDVGNGGELVSGKSLP
jgi:hypothetical protein